MRAKLLAGIAGLLVLAAGAAGARQAADPPHIVFVTGDDEYRSEITMPMIAAILEKVHGLRTTVLYAKPRPQTKDNIEGLEALESADLMVMYARFRRLPEEQLRHVLEFVESGRPLVGLRTTTHAFQYPEGHPRQALNDGFGKEVFGQRWIVHHGHRSSTDVTLHAGSLEHPVLRGVRPFHARSWLYHVTPLEGDATVLLDGTSVGSSLGAKKDAYPPTQPVAWTRAYQGARVFFTTLGHPEDFTHEAMRRLLVNGILWALEREIPAGGADVTLQSPYEPPETFDLSKVQ